MTVMRRTFRRNGRDSRCAWDGFWASSRAQCMFEMCVKH
jgi:hypothetical protein